MSSIHAHNIICFTLLYYVYIIMVQRLTNRNILFNNPGNNEIRINFFIRVHSTIVVVKISCLHTYIHTIPKQVPIIQTILVRETLFPRGLSLSNQRVRAVPHPLQLQYNNIIIYTLLLFIYIIHFSNIIYMYTHLPYLFIAVI